MENKSKTYWQIIRPIWWAEIKLWFGWTDWVNAVFRIAINLGGLWFALFLTENLDDFVGSLAVELGKIIITIFLLLFILGITYIRASQKLYQQQKDNEEKSKDLNERLQSEVEILHNKINWVEVDLKLSTETKNEIVSISLDGINRIDTAYLGVTNNEKLEIIDCYVTLVEAQYYSYKDSRPLPTFSDERLQWKDSVSNLENKITIPAQNSIPKYAKLWSNQHPRGFTLFKPKARIHLNGLDGLYPVTIRVDGKYNGRDIKPVYFNGYFYLERISTIYPEKTDDIPIGIDPYDVIQFKEGNWKNDPLVFRPKRMEKPDEKQEKPKRRTKKGRKKGSSG